MESSDASEVEQGKVPEGGQEAHEKMNEDGDESEDANAEEFKCRPCGLEEGERQRTVRTPKKPNPQEVEEHELTHCPYRSWCEHCVKGQAKDDDHPAVKVDLAESTIVRVIMDYCFLQEGVTTKKTEAEERTTAKSSMTVMVMLETLCHSIWAYAVQAKGATEAWMAEQIVEDLETVGVANERIIMKADQEPAITEVQRSIAAARAGHGTAIEQSKVGDSNTNGKIERCIQDFKGLVRTMRSSLEEKIGEKGETG